MTNQELLNAAPSTLSGLDKQRRYVLKMATLPMPCPACLTPNTEVDALGGDIEAYDFGHAHPEKPFHCKQCHRELRLTVPFIGTNFWRLAKSVDAPPEGDGR